MRILRGVGEFPVAVCWWLVGNLMAIGLLLVVLLVAAGLTLVFGTSLGGLLTVVVVIWWFVKRHRLQRARPGARRRC